MRKAASRREFIGKTAAVAAVGWPAVRSYAAGAQGKPGPNETINLGLIGCGSRGTQLTGSFKPLPGVRFVALCDVHARRLGGIGKNLEGQQCERYRDYRRLLDNKAVDAVIVATNGHWHALPTIHACRAGKDVYVEKPAAPSIGEGRAMVEAAKKYDRIVQIGTQQHSLDWYRKAVEIIQSGRLGRIGEVKVWDYNNCNPGFGNPPDCDPPEGLDWDFWLGPAPKVPYNPNRYRRHYWFFDYGGAWTVDWAVHHYEIIHWAMGTQSPLTALAAGGHHYFDDNTEWPDTFSGTLEYGPCPAAEKGFVLQYTYRTGNRHERHPAGNGKCFFGTDGTLQVNRGGYKLTPEIRATKKFKREEVISSVGTDGPHQRAFIENVRNRTQPETDAEVGHHATTPGHLMNISWRVGRKIRWDAEKEQVVDDPEANALVTKRYRAPWKLEI